MENTGEQWARKVADDLLACRLIARSASEEAGRDWHEHPLMRPPARVVVGKGGPPCFLYARPLRAYSVGGDEMPARMVESVAGGSLVVHTIYSPSGRVVGRDTELRGDPTRN